MDGTALNVAAAVLQARQSIGRGSKRDTPAHVLRHVARRQELSNAPLTVAERKEVQCAAELQIAFEQLQAARERFAKAELAADMAKAKREQQGAA